MTTLALLEIKDYETWWTNVGKKTRNMVRRAEKKGVKVTVVEPSEKFAEGVWKIYNETPIRQERAFSHYGEPLEAVKGNVPEAQKSHFIGAYLARRACWIYTNTLWRQYSDNCSDTFNAKALG